MKKTLALFVICLFLLTTFAGAYEINFAEWGVKENLDFLKEKPATCGGNAIGMANPAAVYCSELGYNYKIEETELGEVGTCIMPNKQECEEWNFLKGNCGQKYSYCSELGYKTKAGEDSAICTTKRGKEIGKVTELIGLTEKSVKGTIQERDLETIEPPRTPLTSPSSFDWRNYNGENWITPIKNQGGCGSCWAFGAVGTAEAMYNIRANNPNLDLNIAEQYLVSDCHSQNGYETCCGGWDDVALNYIKNNGVPDESCMTYVDGSGCSCRDGTCDSNCNYNGYGQCSDRTCSNRCSDWDERLITIDSVQNLQSYNRPLMKTYISEEGPLSVSLEMSSNFTANDIMRCSTANQNHAVVIVGYNDAEQYWIVKNSWGSYWGPDNNG